MAECSIFRSSIKNESYEQSNQHILILNLNACNNNVAPQQLLIKQGSLRQRKRQLEINVKKI